MSTSVLDALETRRTIRNYDPDYAIPQETLDKILNAARLAPTACDFQEIDFIVVRNKEKLDKCRDVVLEAMPDSDMKKHFIDRTKNHGVKNQVTCDAPVMILFVRNERGLDLWAGIDAGIASMAVMTACKHFGLDSMCLGIVATQDTQAKCEEFFGLKKGSLLLGTCIGKALGEQKLKEKVLRNKVTYMD